MDPLTPTRRRELRASAHHLQPVVIVGHQGLTPAVQHEIDLALLKHELIKVRVGTDDRDARAALLAQICAAADCAPVQMVGKILVLWRPNPELAKRPAAPAPARKSGSKRPPPPKTGPRTPLDPVRARRRGTLDAGAPASGKGRRGAARFAPAADPAPVPAEAPPARRRSTFTPKTKPRSFSAKPNPRSAWEKKPAAQANTGAVRTRKTTNRAAPSGATPAPRPRRRRTGP